MPGISLHDYNPLPKWASGTGPSLTERLVLDEPAWFVVASACEVLMVSLVVIGLVLMGI